MAVVLHTTEGDLPVLLHFSECPTAAFNFIALCAARYYDGCSFYRSIPGILLQTGDPTNTGKGGESIFGRLPGSSAQHSPAAVGDEDGPADDADACAVPRSLRAAGPRRYFDDEGFGSTSHAQRGVLSMAHKGSKANTNASQFFLLTSAQPAFDGQYTAFGVVDLDGVYNPEVGAVVDAGTAPGPSGADVLTALESATADVDEKNFVRPKDSVRITGATVLYNPFAEGVIAL